MTPKYLIEAFDPTRHDRSAFACGKTRIDNFLLRTAKKHQRGDFTRVWVATEHAHNRVLGFYSLNAHALEASELPSRWVKHAPLHGGVGAVYLSMIGVDRSRQGRGLGRVLMADAMKRVAQTSSEIGIAFMVLDVLEDGGAFERRKAFYEGLGFISLESRPGRMFVPAVTLRALL